MVGTMKKTFRGLNSDFGITLDCPVYSQQQKLAVRKFFNLLAADGGESLWLGPSQARTFCIPNDEPELAQEP